ncbi:MAG: hypothetical protein ACE5H9_20835 [Anaerolineae bacterium]
MAKFSNLALEKYLAVAFLLLSGCAVIRVAIPIFQHQNLNDDTYITLTYAKNLAQGQGFVYNHPPATLGTTTPLFTMLVAFLANLLPWWSVIEIAILVSVAAWIGAAWIFYLILRQTGLRPATAALAASIPLLTVQGWVGFIGMEIWLFQFLLMLSFYFSLRDKGFLAGLSVGALALTRGEGALVGLILLGYLWHRRRRLPIWFGVGAASVVAIWAVYALLTFGSVIPNTLAAKQAQARLPSGRDFAGRMFLDLLPNYLRSFGVFGLGIVNAYVILIALGFVFVLRRRSVLSLLIVWGVAYLLGYSLLNPSAYYWYVLHVVFIFQLMAGVGLAWLLALVLEDRSARSRMLVGLATTVLAVALLYPGLTYVIFQAQDFAGDARGTPYRAVSRWLAANTAPEDSVAFIEIGYLGYFTDNRIVDLAGLTDPTVTPHIASEGFAWGFWHYQPDYYIYAEEFDWALEEVKSAIDDYTLVFQVDRDAYPTPIYIFRRNSHID